MEPSALTATEKAAVDNRIFLSYNSQDTEWIEQFRALFSELGVRTFVDRNDLPKGVPWQPPLEASMLQANAVVVFIGSNGLGPWQSREISLALGAQIKREREGTRFPVVPILAPGIDPPLSLLSANTFVQLTGTAKDRVLVTALVEELKGGSPQDVLATGNVCPYRGLRPFREIDSRYFFGREAFTSRLFEKIQGHKLICLVGASGSGKSSVLSAGLIPRLRAERFPNEVWDVVTCTPGDSPFRRLAGALIQQEDRLPRDPAAFLEASARLALDFQSGLVRLQDYLQLFSRREPGTDRVLLVVDQFEELFTQSPPKDRARYIEVLLTAVKDKSTSICLSVRADFYKNVLNEGRRFSDAVEQGK